MKCKNCNKEFLFNKHNSANKYCSRRCYEKNRNVLVVKICAYCHKKFKAYQCKLKMGKNKYCSRNCFNQVWTKEIKRICPICNKEFKTESNILKKGKGKFCSMKCRAKMQKVEYEGAGGPGWKGGKVEVKCKECGGSFFVFQYRAEEANFCSKKCVGKWTCRKNQNHPRFGKPFKERIEKQRKSLKERWKDPIFAKKMLQKSGIKPNNLELQFLTILSKEYPKEWKYVGDGQVWFGGKNPDFMNVNGEKKLIEVFGDHWHKTTDEKIRQEHFAKYGFQTLVLWEHEIEENNYENKLYNFCKQGGKK